MAVDWPEMINADKPSLWKPDIERSVQLYNEWFLRFAPRAYRRTRKSSISQVRRAFAVTRNLREINQHILAARPAIISTLRMATSPPLARDRLAGLSGASKSLLETMENNLLPPRSSEDSLSGHLTRICEVVNLLMDRDLFPWIDQGGSVQRRQLEIATSVVADRLSGAVADPVIRNAQETHQLRNIGRYLLNLGYRKVDPISVRNPLEYASYSLGATTAVFGSWFIWFVVSNDYDLNTDRKWAVPAICYFVTFLNLALVFYGVVS